MPRVDLRRLILWMCLFFVLLALGNSLYASYKVQRETLLQNTLEINRVYAQKLAQIVDDHLHGSRKMLEALAWEISTRGQTARLAHAELARMARSSDHFNALFYADASGHVVAAVPSSDKLAGSNLQSAPALRMLDGQAPAIGAPYLAPSGRWLIMMSHPVYDSHGAYAGMVAGTIHLHRTNTLKTVLSEHFYNDGSFIYVVDKTGTLIYHPVTARIGQSNAESPIVQALNQKPAGARQLIDTDGSDILAGYAQVRSVSWGIVVQRPTALATEPLHELFWRTLSYAAPIAVLSLIGIWQVAKLIARPLRQLAEVAANLDDRQHFNRIERIKGWYLEAALLRRALIKSFSAVTSRMHLLHRESETDPLTGLINRRGLETAQAEFKLSGRPFSVVAFDVDHFKRINDSFGHAAGDKTLQAIAHVAQTLVREADIIARVGGEEFVALLPGSSLEAAEKFAERLRSGIAEARMPTGEPLTISAGVAQFPAHGPDFETVMHCADAALYEAKNAGRNCVRVSRA